jgi:hypothetical protein
MVPLGKNKGVSQLGYNAWTITAWYGNDDMLAQMFVAGPSVSPVFGHKEQRQYLREKTQAYQKREKEIHP